MSAVASSGTHPPGEADLQELYNQVLAGFAEESPTTESVPKPAINIRAENARDPPYSPRSDDSPAATKPSRAPIATPRTATSPRDNSRPLPSPTMYNPQSPTQGRSPRPLPRLPGASPSASPTFPAPTHMPEAHPYYPDSATPTSPSGKTNGDHSRRPYLAELPPNGSASTVSDRYRGLPSDPRPTNRVFATLRPGSSSAVSTSPSQVIGHTRQANSMQYTMPIPGTAKDSTYGQQWNGRNASNGATAESTFQRQPSVRPVGASAPRIPGFAWQETRDDGPPSSSDSYVTSSSTKSGSSYFSTESYSPTLSTTSIPPPPSLVPGNLAVPAGKSSSRINLDPSALASREDILAPGIQGYARPISNGSTVERPVGRATSTASTSSTQVSGLERNFTTSTVATTSTMATTYSSKDGTINERPYFDPSDSFGSKSRLSDANAQYPSNRREPSITVSDVSNQPAPSEATTRSRLAADIERTMASMKTREAMESAYQDEYDDDEYDDYDESEEALDSFVNFSLLSNIAVWLRDQVPRGTHVKGSIPYPHAFTGKDIVSALQSRIRTELLINQGVATDDRLIALQVARSLQQQLFFYEVEWGGRVLQDGVEDVYMFLDDQERSADAPPEREELPTSVITVLTKCYSPSCSEVSPCYSFACPRRPRRETTVIEPHSPEPIISLEDEDWPNTVDHAVLESLPQSEINRQTIIHRLISKEVQYVRDLDLVESIFIKPLRVSEPPVIPRRDLEGFIEAVFGNLMSVRDTNRRLIERLNVRQREQSLVIKRVGDILLEFATEFRLIYPEYVGHLPQAEKRLKDEMDSNSDFRLFLERCERNPDARRIDLKVFLNRPAEHLQKYEITLEAIVKETAEGNPDADYLTEAVHAFKNLQTVCHLQTFQHAMGKGPTGKYDWNDLVPADVLADIPKKEQKRQNILFELIKGEMQYVRDLENMDVIFVQGLRIADPPIIPRERLPQFIDDVFHNFGELHSHHRRLLDNLHHIQREEHPVINTVTAAIFDAALHWHDAYMEYVPNYPIAEYRIVDEMNNNPAFKEFVEQCTRHPDSNRLDMKSFVNRPIPRLARYELLLKGVQEASPEGHEDRESIPGVIDVIKSLLKETQPGVVSAERKAELWRYNANLVFKPGEQVDMDLLGENRSLLHTGKLLRQPDTGFEWSGWSELFVLLFDNYLVMTKPKEKDGVVKFHVNRRPIPLDLLTLANFTDPGTQRGTGILRGFGAGGNREAGPPATASPEAPSDSRIVYPCTIHHNGRLGGLYTVYAETPQARTEWKEKLEEAMGLRKVVQESNKVFEVETLSADTFLVPSLLAPQAHHSWNSENSFTGRVTCSVPFTTADGRALVAVGCAEGVWIGFRHDSRSMRRVLHLKMVTQCAMLEEFGIFLVLADKSLFAYHIEALVPTSPQSANTSQTPQKLNGTKDVHFFSVGSLGGRTLVIYMKKKGLDSVFRVLEPVVGKINEKAKAPVSLSSRLGLRQPRSEWFRVYRDFFLPSESYDLIFLKARIAILCTKGFEIMDLSDFKSVTIPQRDDARHEKLAKRCEACRPMGMFRSSENEFLLCYDEFGLYVNRHGDPSRTKNTVEWEGTVERVAFHPPYILLFSSTFIEVRNVENGRLCQIVPGNELRCIWDGRGGSTSPAVVPGPNGTWIEAASQEARVHGVMRADDSQKGATRAVAQHVFELIPTIPLYVPEKLSSPTHQTSFAHGTLG